MTSDSYFTLGFYVRKPQTERAEYPIFARISVAGQATEFKIGRTVDPENWDAKKHLCRGRTRRDLELNKYLEMVRAKLCDIHNMLIREKKPVNPGVLKSLFLGNGEKPKMMIEVFREANEHRKEEYERGDIVKVTYQRWSRCADYMEEFFRSSLKTPDIPIKEVTSGILDDFQHYLRMKKDCANNAAVRYLRCVKNVMQYALAHKWITHDPFYGKIYSKKKTNREHLTEAELNAVMSLDLKQLPRLEAVRDVFVFCCFTGLAFSDVSTLTADMIVSDADGEQWIRKHREKTDELSSIPLLEIPRQILAKYSGHKKINGTGRLLPVLSNQRCNGYLKEIADLAGIPKKLTTHVARHTFACMSLDNHVSIETISKMLGHSDIRTTQIYAKTQDKTIYEDMESMRHKFDCAMMN